MVDHQRDMRFDDQKPTEFATNLVAEEAFGAPNPSASDRRPASESAAIHCQGSRDTRGAPIFSTFAIEPIGALTRGEHRWGVAQPPRRSSKTLKSLRRFASGQRRFEMNTRFLPRCSQQRCLPSTKGLVLLQQRWPARMSAR
jgi:hypothetical protein